jgi:hypothetical protein
MEFFSATDSNSMKKCKTCGEQFPKSSFPKNSKMCRPCHENHKALYAKNYYAMHRTRLSNNAKEYYYANHTHRNKIGRPIIHEPEEQARSEE